MYEVQAHSSLEPPLEYNQEMMISGGLEVHYFA